MLGTQFEPTDARRVFPCWDEPVFRAKFGLTVVVPQGEVAVSNMPVESERPDLLVDPCRRPESRRMVKELEAGIAGLLDQLLVEDFHRPLRQRVNPRPCGS